MFELEVPFLEKDRVKELGARWNAKTKKWFVPAGVDVNLFRKWWPIGIEPDQLILANNNSYNNEINHNTDSNSDPNNNNILVTNDKDTTANYTLSGFLERVKYVINQSFSSREWIIAEISELSMHNGNYYITLVEYDDEGHKKAQINARIWRDRTAEIIQKFNEATGAELAAGIKVLLYASLSFHPQYGMALTIDDIDPNYTLGDMAAKVRRIIEQLKEERILTNNKQLPLPTEFTRIAVISPTQAAGLGDFTREADLLTKYGLCEFIYFTATFQGKNAPQEITDALNQVLIADQTMHFDALVIIRGGGSVADLAWLNDLALARVVCTCSLHVMVGIGHKRDYTVLDEIAGGRFDTPSKVIAHIFQIITHNAENATNNFALCLKYAEQTLLLISTELERIISNINQNVLSSIENAYRDVFSLWQLILENLKHHLLTEEQKITALMREIICQGPEAILSKGFAIATSLSGEIITSCKAAVQHEQFNISFHDGSLLVNTQSF